MGNAGHRFRLQPQQEQGCTRLFDCQRQAATGGKIQLCALAPAFDHQCAQPRAAGGIGRTPEQRLGVGNEAQHQRARIAAQVNEARHVKSPAALLGLVTLEPEDWRSRRPHAKREHRGEPRRAGHIIGIGGEQLVKPSPREPST